MHPDTLPRAYVSAGSNIEPEHNLRIAIRELRRRFDELELSSVYRTAAVGFSGDDFLNLVLSFATTLSIEAVVAELDDIEAAAGRQRHGERFASRTLDLDLLMYADRVIDSPQLKLPRDDIVEYAFVLGPLAEIAPDLVHPVERLTIGQLWGRFDQEAQPIRRVAVSLD